MEQKADVVELLFHGCQRAYQVALQTELSTQKVEGISAPLLMMLLQSRGKDGTLPTQRELADTMHVSPAAVAMSLKSLERLGYVERQADPADQRCKRIAITPRGTETAQSCWRAVCTVNQRMLADFTAEEREQLAGYQRRMLQNLNGSYSGMPENPFERMESKCSKP